MRPSASLLPAAFAAFSCAAEPSRTIYIPDPDPKELKKIKNECDEAEVNLHNVLRQQPCNRVAIGAFQEVFRLKCGRVVSKSLAEVDWDVEKHLQQCKIYEDTDKARQAKCSEASASYRKTLEEALQNDPCKWIFDERQQIDSACAGLLSEKDSADINWKEEVLKEKCEAGRELDAFLNSRPNDKCREAIHELTIASIAAIGGMEFLCRSDAQLNRLRAANKNVRTVCASDLKKPRVRDEIDHRSTIADIYLRACARINYEQQRR